MSNPKEWEEYALKRKECLSKFPENFSEYYYNNDPMFTQVADMLTMGADPYTIIAQLIVDRKRLIDENIKLAMKQRVEYFIPKP